MVNDLKSIAIKWFSIENQSPLDDFLQKSLA